MERMAAEDSANIRRFAQIAINNIDLALHVISDLMIAQPERRIAAVLARTAGTQHEPVIRVSQAELGRLANASRKLAVSSKSLEQVRLGAHLQDLCDDIEKGLSRPAIGIHCDLEDIVVGADDTVSVSILVNELVTNALRHGAGDIVTRGSLVDGELSVAVTDAGTELPALLPADPYRVGGVGLMIVDRLADRWGVHRFRGGKTVWATLASGRG